MTDPLPAVCAKQWRASVEGRDDRTPNPELELEVRYERLSEDPTNELNRICNFVGISDPERVLGHFYKEAKAVFDSRPALLSPSEQDSIKAIIVERPLAERTRKPFT